MSNGEINGELKLSSDLHPVVRGIIFAALLSGAGSGAYTYKTAASLDSLVTHKDLALLEKDITMLRELSVTNRQTIERLDSRTPSQEFTSDVKEALNRLRILELKEATRAGHENGE